MTSPMGIDNHLMLSWVDSVWLPALSSGNVLDYFAERSNPFYDRSCNNELLRMQRRPLEHLVSMVGIEYTLLHTQDPILYVIRKQRRHSPTQTTPLAHYNIIAGIVYRSPDIGSVINSRVLNSVFNVQSAFKEAQEFARYTPSKGYFWQFKNESSPKVDKLKKKKTILAKPKEEPSSLFQRQRVDECLSLLTARFPIQAAIATTPVSAKEISTEPPLKKIKTEDAN